MDKETQKELFDLLYALEIKFQFDETEIGKRIGILINKLQNQLITK